MLLTITKQKFLYRVLQLPVISFGYMVNVKFTLFETEGQRLNKILTFDVIIEAKI